MGGIAPLDKQKIIHSFFKNRTCVIATMHKKEEVMSPIPEDELVIRIIVPKGFNTDQFGTFAKDVERMGNQSEAAKYKAEAAMSLTGETLALSSEGSFGPHPAAFFFRLTGRSYYCLIM